MRENIKELTLLLLYLTSWKESDRLTGGSHRSWKGYPFKILDELIEEGYIYGSNKAKSIYFKEEGIKETEKMLKKYIK
ncbi:DUF6429 family protein [Alkaliphilus serpentinus]|uniref:Transposase n=1 Tax=Alkaliphilus serpentinus TaxID=1482731 RepID=A0A833M9X2_9FIRM|nr:DUF6429 family protein [Alkaliphilus serpentinus]KAB3529588.1 transposase [Alkaliphilus serpentinus]